jgi:hypothetical protein
MGSLSNFEIKEIFVSSMKRSYDFKCGPEPNAFMIKLGNEKFLVYLNNCSGSFQKTSPDVTRMQLKPSTRFSEATKKGIVVIVLGYDQQNDVFVTWNPEEIQGRLNEKRNTSLYSRKSVQQAVRGKEFKEGRLTNGAMFIVFKSHLLPDYFKDYKNLFEDTTEAEDTDNEISNQPENRISKITDKDVLRQLTPLLKGHRVLEAAAFCHKVYGAKYKGMKMKDWLNLTNDLFLNQRKD